MCLVYSLVSSCRGGAGPAATVFLKRLVSKTAERHDMLYRQAMAWLRCRKSFALLRGSILCLRGSRRRTGPLENTILEPATVVAESSVV